MFNWRRLESWLSWVPWYRRRTRDSDLARELRDHLDLEAEECRGTGLSPQHAAYAAHRALGNTLKIEEDVRRAWGFQWLETFAHDIHFAARMLRKSPGFTAVAILTLALGIGATTAVFSVVDSTLLRSLPYPHSQQLVRIVDDLPGIGAHDVAMSVPEWWDFEHSGIFEYASPITGGSVNLTGASRPARIRFLGVAPNYFALLGTKPQLGRVFNPKDATPGFTLEVLISDGLWKSAFGSDPHILGKSLRLDNDLYHVVGVMPPGFHDPGQDAYERNADAWLANNFNALPNPAPMRSSRFLTEPIARLSPGLTVPQAQSRMDALVASLQKQFPTDYPVQSSWTVRLVPLKEALVGSVRQPLFLLLGAMGLVLLIACVNVANLLLARATARGREMAVRQALGAARGRLIRQLLTESMLLAFLGGIAGLAVLFSTKSLLLRLVPPTLPQLNAVSIDWTVLLFALASSIIAGVIFGLAPALQLGRLDLIHMFKRDGRSATGSTQQGRTRGLLVTAELALSLVLVVAAGLLLHSFWNLLNISPGFKPQNVTAVRLWLPVPNDPNTDPYRTVAQETTLVREILRRGRLLPGVQEIALGDMGSIPLSHEAIDLNPFRLIREDVAVEPNQAPVVNVLTVTPDYFHLLGISLLRGRAFTELDNNSTASAAVVNETLARTYWPNSDAVGKHLALANFRSAGISPNTPWTTVVGVVADVRTESLGDPGIPQIYLSLYQRRAKDLAIFLRGQLDAAAIPDQVREQVQAIDPTLPTFGAQTLDDALSASLAERRFSMEIIALFALTALFLAALGIYGVISYVVSRRTHEIGIRVALGAQRSQIRRLMLRQGFALVGIGVVLGILAAAVLSRFIRSFLFGVGIFDPVTYLTATLVLAAVALLACYLPARRAMKVDPMIALRYE